MARKKITKPTNASVPSVKHSASIKPVFDHPVEVPRRRQAAAAAFQKHEDGWRCLADRLADDFPYIEHTRCNFDEMKLAAAAAGFKIVEAPEDPVRFLLKLIYPEKARQRISEWTTALEIAHKHGWSADQGCSVLIT